ncbi:MAG: sigma-70 family RNA polymerase sigma factor [Acidobacteria bacterium]|nr:sigma-70 family RNA polymerase sigma factor [Acidobacteriota bacterium]
MHDGQLSALTGRKDFMTDEQLLTEASRGDEAAFLELYERHRDAVFRFAYRLLGSIEPAEDIAHDCFLSLIQHAERFDPSRASLRTYLYGAARNLAMKHFRRTGQDVAVDEALDAQLPMDESLPLDQLLDEEVSRLVQRAVASLPPLQREALVLFEYEELSLAEIARVVSADVGTVKARLHRARKSLKRSLAGYFAREREALEEACR